MELRAILQTLERLSPLGHAETWDNVGLLVGDPAADVSRVLLAIDATLPVIEEARDERRSLVVAYHPPIFKPLARFVAGHPAFEAARAGIAVWSPHTALDVAAGGTNDVLADALGMRDRAPLRLSRQGGPEGIGRIGQVEGTVAELVARVKASFEVDRVLIAGPREGAVTRAAVCAGAGGDLLADAIAGGASLFLTGELRHHDALLAASRGVTVVALRHSASERKALEPLAARLREAHPALDVAQSARDREPFEFA